MALEKGHACTHTGREYNRGYSMCGLKVGKVSDTSNRKGRRYARPSWMEAAWPSRTLVSYTTT